MNADEPTSLLRGDALRRALMNVAPLERDGWVDRTLGLEPLETDSAELPPGGVPYLPAAVGSILRAIDELPIRGDDVFVDLGCGAGRTLALVQLLTKARVHGVEIQTALVGAAASLAGRLRLGSFSVERSDAANLTASAAEGTVFFLYCPFDIERVKRVLDQLEPIAARRAIRIACVDFELPPVAWLTARSSSGPELVFYESRLR